MDKILGFFGPFRFLSNFWPARVEWAGFSFPSTEAAYQFAKLKDSDREAYAPLFKDADGPGAAKRLGRKVEIRDDWEAIKPDTPVNNRELYCTQYKTFIELIQRVNNES